MRIAILIYDMTLLDIIILKLESDSHIKYDIYDSYKKLIKNNISYDLILLDDIQDYFVNKSNIDEIHFIVFISLYNNKLYTHAFQIMNAFDFRTTNIQSEFQKLISGNDTYFFHTVKGELFIKEFDILYFYFSYESVYMVTNHDIVRLYIVSLKSLEYKLGASFIRVNRNNIININKVVKLDKSNHDLCLDNGVIINISDRKWKSVKELYFSL